MKSDGLSKLYDTLTLDERFRLRLRAFARRDMTDCERLDRTCPSTQYKEYCDRIEASDVLTLCILVELLPKLAKLRMVDAFRPRDGVRRTGWRAGRVDGLPGRIHGGMARCRRAGRPSPRLRR